MVSRVSLHLDKRPVPPPKRRDPLRALPMSPPIKVGVW